jgi:cytochrome P450
MVAGRDRGVGVMRTMTAADAEQTRGHGPVDDSITLEELVHNPYPAYRSLREHGVTWVPAVNRWLVARWDDIDKIERDGESFTARERGSLQTRVMGRTMLRTDGEEHKRLRKAAQGPLTPRAVEEHMLPRFKRIADDYIDRFAQRGSGDLFSEFAGPFAARCLAEVLGLVDATDEELQRWSQALMDGTANYGDDPVVWARCDAAVAEIDAATTAAIERVRAEPDSSVISAMVHAGGDGEPLREEEVRANTKLIIGGGLNEPRDGLGVALWGLLTHREQLQLALEDPSWWPRATEESMRWVSPLAMFPREVAKPVTFGDTRLEPGARLGLIVGSANRDERHWERPDEFDITRPKARNVAFGVGHHFCLGVWMARHQIGGAALPALFERLPNLRLDLDAPPIMRGWVFRGPTTLPVLWDPVPARSHS